MWPEKSIQSLLIVGGFALALLAGCAKNDCCEPQADSSSKCTSDDKDQSRTVAGHDAQPAHHQGHDRDDDDDDGDDDDNGKCAAPNGKTHRAPAAPSKSDSAVTAAPSLDELPNLKPPPRSMSSRVDVEGSLETTKRPVVLAYKEVPLTPEEKKALGKDDDKPDDILAFYKPQGSVEQGVSSRETDLRIGIAGRGGATVGTSSNPPRVDTFGVAGRHAEPYGPLKRMVGVDIRVPILVRVGPSYVLQVGWGPPRTGAAQMPYLEP